MLCHRLVLMFPHVCDEYYPQYQGENATHRAGNLRIDLLGRRSQASFVPPGYVALSSAMLSLLLIAARVFMCVACVHVGTGSLADDLNSCLWLFVLVLTENWYRYLVSPDEKQATFTGEQQRGGVWFMMFIVLGLYSPGTKPRQSPKNKTKGNLLSQKATQAGSKAKRSARSYVASATPPASATTDGILLGRTIGVSAEDHGLHPEQQLDVVLASLLADIDKSDDADATATAASAVSAADSAIADIDDSCASEASGDSFASAARTSVGIAG